MRDKQPVLYFDTRLAAFYFAQLSLSGAGGRLLSDSQKSDRGGCPMGQRNDNQSEINDLQNRFTAYLMTAVRRQKCAYNKKRTALQVNEHLVDRLPDEISDEEVLDMVIDRFPPMMQLEDAALMQAISGLTSKERYILFERILNERSYSELGKPLGLQYKGTAAAYRRIVEKLRKELR